jgi:SAM-dependent methyltransferase
MNPRDPQIIGTDPWLDSPAGHYLLQWEQAQLDEAVADVFGFHAAQLGWGALDALRANRMPHRWLVCDGRSASQWRARHEAHNVGPATAGPGAGPSSIWPQALGAPPLDDRVHAPVLLSDYDALPFPSQSLDLVVLPHTLELSRDAHETLREVERVLMPEGRLVVLGFNPTSLWGLRQRFGGLGPRLGQEGRFLPREAGFIGYWRLRDWMKLLGFHIELGRFGCYRPALVSPLWMERLRWMDRTGERWWPVLGAVYCLVAVKRVQGMRLLGPAWKRARAPARAPAVVAQREAGVQRAVRETEAA